MLSNNLRMCEFAITNICTARCRFCSIWKQEKKIMVDTEKALKTISHLSRLGFSFVTLTGGEPLLHPDFEKMIERCNQESITSAILDADPRIFTEKRLAALGRNKPDLVSISVDHHTEDVIYEARSLPQLLSRAETAVQELKDRGIKTMASALISRYNHDSLKPLMEKCHDMGFDYISINYPEFSESPVYTLGGEAVRLSKPELIRSLKDVLALSKDYPIVNPELSLKNIIGIIENGTAKFTCLGGYRVFFVDWFFQAHPCMHLSRSMGDVLSLQPDKFEKVACNSCTMSWYRDFSIYFQGLRSIRALASGFKFVLADFLH